MLGVGLGAGTHVAGRMWVRRWYRQNVLLLAVVGIAVLPLAWRGPSCGQDFDFHLQSWMEVVAHWRAVVVYPHWAASANYGAGEPRFVFYPPLSWMLGGLLGVVLPWSWTGFVYTALALLGGAWSFRAMARVWLSEETASLAACVYAVNPYMLFVAYERAALAELLAAVWMPLLVLYGLRRSGSAVPLALTVAALWLTNAPAAVMGMYFLALLVVVAAIEERRWRLVRRAAAAAAAGLGLAAFWLVPAWYQERWVEIWRAIGQLMRVQDSFLFGFVSPAHVPAEERLDAVYHNHLLGMASWIVVALLVATAAAAALSWPKRSRLWWPLAAAGAAIAALQFRWSAVVWRVMPQLRYLQFPWRWLLVLGLVMAALVGIASGRAGGLLGSKRMRGIAAVGLACAMALLAATAFWQPCDEDDNVQAQVATFHDTGFEGTDEYTPRGAVNSEIEPGLPPVRVLWAADAEEGPLKPDEDAWTPTPADEIPATVRIGDWSGERRSAVVRSPDAGYAVLRLMDYPAWRVTVNGAAMPLAARVHRGDGLMAIPVKAGTSRIAVRWRTTPDAWAGRWISLAALAITLAWMWQERRAGRDENVG